MSGDEQISPDITTTAGNKAERVPGTGKGIWMAPDFDAPLSDFEDYM
jgi:hypothetical protein